MKYSPPIEDTRPCENPECGKEMSGRANKKFCNVKCRNTVSNLVHNPKRPTKDCTIDMDDFPDCTIKYTIQSNGKAWEFLNNESDEVDTDSKERKDAPVFTGFMQYFPNAIFEVARLSKSANDKHNPNEPLHWSKHKSNDHGDCLARHQLEVGTVDSDGFDHAVKVAWRAMAQLEILLTNKK